MEPPKTLLLTETGLASLPDGSIAVNVGPIVRALKFLTEGRGDDRGLDEAGNPLPDLMSLAFEVVESIIVGGRKADAFRRVKSELDAQAGGTGRSSLALAKRASRVQPPADEAAEIAALAQAADALQALLAGLQGATEQLLTAMNALGVAPPAKRKKKAKAKAPRRRAAPKAKRKAPLKKAAKRKRKSR
ncbi:MAG TPA: hypothetical protein VNG33_18445 [Polyangiaceae bacterium]|nr:hypothetical protein [Polyangiaceae bacterium]